MRYTYNSKDFKAILSIDDGIDIQVLREAATCGCPAEVRAEVWKLLLGVSKADPSHESSEEHRLRTVYSKKVKESEKYPSLSLTQSSWRPSDVFSESSRVHSKALEVLSVFSAQIKPEETVWVRS